MTDEHPSPVDRLRVGFATAVEGLNDGTMKAVVVVAITSAGRGCKIWDYGDVPACARVGEAIRRALYMPTIVDVSNSNRGMPREGVSNGEASSDIPSHISDGPGETASSEASRPADAP